MKKGIFTWNEMKKYHVDFLHSTLGMNEKTINLFCGRRVKKNGEFGAYKWSKNELKKLDDLMNRAEKLIIEEAKIQFIKSVIGKVENVKHDFDISKEVLARAAARAQNSIPRQISNKPNYWVGSVMLNLEGVLNEIKITADLGITSEEELEYYISKEYPEATIRSYEINGKKKTLNNDPFFWVGTAIIRFSTGLKRIKITADLGITSEEELKEYIKKEYPGATLESYEINDVIKTIDNGEIYEQLLYANLTNDCVDKFKANFNLEDEDRFYNGMKQKEFNEVCKDYNIAVYDNNYNLVNGVEETDKRVLCYSGHVVENFIPKSRDNPPKEYVDDLTGLFKQFMEERDEFVIRDIYIYDGAFGKWLNSFKVGDQHYIRKFKTPTQKLMDNLKDYGCNFYHPIVKNCAIYSGVAYGYGYDLTRCYQTAFENIKRIPIIDNVPLTLEAYNKLYKDRFDAVVVADEFKYKNILFPVSFWYLEDAERLGLEIKEVHLITEFKDFDAEKVLEYDDNDDEITNDEYFIYERQSEKQIIRMMIGSLIMNKHRNYREFYSANLDDLFNTDKKHSYYKKIEDVGINTVFYHNVYFAMMSVYHNQLIELIDVLKPNAVFCDCLYTEKKLTYEEMEYYNLKLEKEANGRDCQKYYEQYKVRVCAVKGKAGTGKTTYVKNWVKEAFGAENALVIIPENRLSRTWEGFKCLSFQWLMNAHKMPNKKVLIIDEVYKFNTEDINTMIALGLSHEMLIFTAGDPYQLEQLGVDNYRRRYYYMPTFAHLTKNWRNDFDDYKFIINNKNSDELKTIYDKYLKQFEVKEDDFDDVVYCYLTNGNDSTRSKHDRLYKQHVMDNLKDDDLVYVRCVKNYKNYFNGLIYQMPKREAVKLKPSYFVISCCYSIYATQGLTLSSLRLLADDQKYYTSNWRLLYVLISRLSTHKYNQLQ